MTLFRLFTLHPEIFSSFLSQSLVARGISKDIINVERINWREKYGLGNYKQVDDKPFGGGSGMVLLPEPIYLALNEFDALSELYQPKTQNSSNLNPIGIIPEMELLSDPLYDNLLKDLDLEKKDKHFEQQKGELENVQSQAEIFSRTKQLAPRIFPNNFNFFNTYKSFRKPKKVTISLTPRGFPINQQIVEWLAKDFDEVNILCGRYEGFDARVSEFVDLELSLGNFVLNGGEVASMALIEAVARLLPDFVTKSTSVTHDSFSKDLNQYVEQQEFVIGKNKLKNSSSNPAKSIKEFQNPFNNYWYKSSVLPLIEHPQYTRPITWQGLTVPDVLKNGNHKKIQEWREKWY